MGGGGGGEGYRGIKEKEERGLGGYSSGCPSGNVS